MSLIKRTNKKTEIIVEMTNANAGPTIPNIFRRINERERVRAASIRETMKTIPVFPLRERRNPNGKTLRGRAVRYMRKYLYELEYSEVNNRFIMSFAFIKRRRVRIERRKNDFLKISERILLTFSFFLERIICLMLSPFS